MAEKIQVGIVGATGYAGEELLRLLLSHPQAEIAAISSISFEGKKISEIYPSLYQRCDQVLVDEDKVIEKSDVIFASVPHGVSEKLAKKVTAHGKKLIDLGADFRLKQESDYQEWYGLSYHEPQLHEVSCYCIPELHRSRITSNISIIGNPGCYPTSIALGLAPIAKSGLGDLSTLILDSKSGVTGAGRGLSQTTHYPDCNEAFSPYKTACHRHTPEIEQTLSELSGQEVKVTFVPHLLPVNRGIVSTMYMTLHQGADMTEIRKLYEEFYRDELFVRVLPDGETANLKNIKYSNFCDISLHYDRRTNRLIVVSTIDNMVKGAAGQAIQNMNLLFGIEESTGLMMVPPAF
jgi:N-acetyl-gamma-glutamyl-phosphate reductase